MKRRIIPRRLFVHGAPVLLVLFAFFVDFRPLLTGIHTPGGSAWNQARATQVMMDEHPCPLDGTDTRIFVEVSSNTQGGYDSDFCIYSSEGQFREYALATCPEDLVTLYPRDFRKTYDEATLERFREVSRKLHEDYPDLDAVEIWDRYDFAARFYEVLERDHAFLGNLYLRASWTARDEGVGYYAGLEGPDAAFALIRQGRKELEKPLDVEQRKRVLYNLARVAWRAGDNEVREEMLAAFVAAGELTAKEREAVERFRRMAGEVEPRFQEKALAHFQAHLEDRSASAESRLRSRYLVADLLRRLGRPEQALRHYRAVTEADGTPPEVERMAAFFVEKLENGASSGASPGDR